MHSSASSPSPGNGLLRTDYGWVVMEGLLQPNWFDGPAIPHNQFRPKEVWNLATTDKLDASSETESSDKVEWSQDSDGSDCKYDVY